eukprot:UC1_evm1s648
MIQKAGGMISESLDERATTILDALNVGKNQRVAALEAQIASAEEEKQSLKGFEEVFAVHRELNDMNRELTFRMQQHNARDAVEKQLNDFVALESAVRQAEQAEIVAQLEADVMTVLSGKSDDILKKCVADLTDLSKAQKA